MKRFLPFLLCLAVSVAGLVSCESFAFFPDQEIRVPLKDFEVGVYHKSSMLDKAFKKEQDYFSAFTDAKMFDFIETNTPDTDVTEGKSLVKRNKVEYSEKPDDQFFTIQTIPEKNVDVLSVFASSSDTTVLQIVGADVGTVAVKMLRLGDTDLTVTMVTEKETVTHVYPLRLIGTVDLKFRITPYWLRRSATKIRMNIKGIPAGTDDLVLLTKDSVTIHAYCEWYDFENTGSTPHVERYDVYLPMKSKWIRYKRNTMHLLRDITPQMKEICSRYVQGSMVTQTTINEADGTTKVKLDTVSHKYYYFPENVTLDVLIVSDDPFVEFKVRVKCKKTNDVLNEIYVEWEEDPDDIGDQVVDESLENDDEEPEDEEWQRESEAYFTVRLNDFLTQAQRDSLMRIVDDKKREYGYTAELSEEEKDKALEEINREFEEKENEGDDDNQEGEEE